MPHVASSEEADPWFDGAYYIDDNNCNDENGKEYEDAVQEGMIALELGEFESIEC